MTVRMKRTGLFGRAAAVAVLWLAVQAAPARADLVLSTFPTQQTSNWFFNIIATNTGPGPVSFEGYNVLFDVGPNSVITGFAPPSQQVPNNPPFVFFPNTSGFFYGFNQLDPVTFLPAPNQGVIGNLLFPGVETVFTLAEGQSVNLGTIFYQPTIIPNGAVIDPIIVDLGLSSFSNSDGGPGVLAGGASTQVFFNGGDGTTNDPQAIGSIFIPEPTTMLAFAGLLGLGAVAARQRKAA